MALPDGAVVAAPDRCPHREAPLSLGAVEGGCLVCPYHGWTFGDGGRCVAVPSAAPGGPVPPKAHLPVVRVTERYGLVWVCPGTPRSPIPTIVEEDDPSYRRINSGVERWSTSVTRMTDNFLDIAHFPYVHVGTFGAATSTEVPTFEITDLDDDFVGYRYEVEVGNELGAASSGVDAPVVTRRMTTGFALPFTVRSTIHYETGLDHVILLCSTPIDDVHSYFTFVVWRNDDHTCRPRRSSPSTGRSAPRTSGCSSGCRACCRSTPRGRSACRPTGRRWSGAAGSPPPGLSDGRRRPLSCTGRGSSTRSPAPACP